ncbi:MAG TPA: S41 family peptidase [Balneolales bacterium]|nr:S41 family peptidase [Balneolales bacterium]
MRLFRIKILLFLFVLTFINTSCDKFLLPKDPPDNPIENFNTLWKEYDAHYSYFIYKKVNWDSLYSVYRPQITENTNNDRLFTVMAHMLSNLKDGHVYLKSPFQIYTYDDWYENYVDHFNLTVIEENYFKNNYKIAPTRKMLYGQLTPEIGYIYIITFGGTGWTSELDPILKNLHDTNGLIIDIRDNFGGNDYTMLSAADHFTDQKRLFRYIRYRNGPKHDDFTAPIKGYIKPSGKTRYTGNIVVLTNRGVFSAAESFVLAMNTLPYVTTIGDTTGGGTANPIDRELPNGWTYSISTWIETSLNGIVHEGIGIPPKIPVKWGKTDLSSSKDLTLETAINYLTRIIHDNKIDNTYNIVN